MPVLKNWREEKQAAFLYGLIAKCEVDPVRKKMFLELADAAEKQAKIWISKLKKNGKSTTEPVYHPDFRTRLVGKLIAIFGAQQIRFILSAMKVRGMSIYSGAHTSHPTASHVEQRHKGLNTAGNLRAAVFGVSDGLISNVSLLLGVVGANADLHFVVLSGTAGLLAGACSMAAGEYVSMTSQREFFEYQIELEQEELELYPEEEAAELACIYRARGVAVDDAKKMANKVISNKDIALDTLAREELGLNPDELGSPWGAAISSFMAFALGAFIPLLPFVMSAHGSNIIVSLVLTGISLLVIGGMLSLFTNRSAILGGLRMLIIGGLAGGVTFLIGKLVGVTLL
ncbi:MAG: VIT1/CCC1 transporter family protein [Gammaproteobacteria bacterium]